MAHLPPQDDPTGGPIGGEMPLVQHLTELRNRLLWCVGAVLVAFVICYGLSKPIYDILAGPLRAAGIQDLIATGLVEPVFTYLKVAFWAAIFVSFPVIATQLWRFVAPGLYSQEKRAFLPFLAATPLLFMLGALMVYFVILPLLIRFSLSLQSTGDAGGMGLRYELKISEYLDLTMALLLAFGACFQLPVLLTLLGRAGIVSSAMLASKRRWAIVGAFAVAAVATPPDAISQVSLAVPMCLLYEISIWLVRAQEAKRRREERKAEAAEAAPRIVPVPVPINKPAAAPVVQPAPAPTPAPAPQSMDDFDRLDEDDSPPR